VSDFLLTPELASVRAAVRDLVDTQVIPAESQVFEEDRAGKRDTLKRLQAAAKHSGLWTPHLPKDLGGRGLGPMGMCALFREMGRSPIGAKVFHCDAPDQGNMDLLVQLATPAQRTRFLEPLVRGEVTSAFCMTEPAPGAGSDPGNLKTTARRVPGGWELEGHKWFSTGARNASFLLVMARTSDDPRRGASLFILDKNLPGVRHLRDVPTMGDQVLDHHEGELTFEKVRLPEQSLIGVEGDGFVLAQTRLVPARLTHCMRWLGLADRTLAMCRAYVTSRISFGKELARHQEIQRMIYDSAEGIHAGNVMTLHAAWLLEKGDPKAAKPYSSIAKTFVANTLCRVLDHAIQMHGGMGYSEDLPFSAWNRAARAARIADGPDEVHHATVARDWLLGRIDLLV
jgi:acyl-CoA dehydrogenase